MSTPDAPWAYLCPAASAHAWQLLSPLLSSTHFASTAGARAETAFVNPAHAYGAAPRVLAPLSPQAAGRVDTADAAEAFFVGAFVAYVLRLHPVCDARLQLDARVALALRLSAAYPGLPYPVTMFAAADLVVLLLNASLPQQLHVLRGLDDSFVEAMCCQLLTRDTRHVYELVRGALAGRETRLHPQAPELASALERFACQAPGAACADIAELHSRMDARCRDDTGELNAHRCAAAMARLSPQLLHRWLCSCLCVARSDGSSDVALKNQWIAMFARAARVPLTTALAADTLQTVDASYELPAGPWAPRGADGWLERRAVALARASEDAQQRYESIERANDESAMFNELADCPMQLAQDAADFEAALRERFVCVLLGSAWEPSGRAASEQRLEAEVDAEIGVAWATGQRAPCAFYEGLHALLWRISAHNDGRALPAPAAGLYSGPERRSHLSEYAARQLHPAALAQLLGFAQRQGSDSRQETFQNAAVLADLRYLTAV